MTSIYEIETALCSVKTYKKMKSSKIAANFIANLFAGATGAKIEDNYKLILTDEHLYIETISYSELGGRSEGQNIEVFPIGDIISFDIEEKSDNTAINITTNKDRICFICNNESESKSALIMSKLIMEFKNCK